MSQLIPLRPLGENALRSALVAAVKKPVEQPRFLIDCQVCEGLPVFQITAERSSWRSIGDWFFQLSIPAIQQCKRIPLYRGVSLEATQRILENGIDVIPTDAVIWANALEKALEYGGENQLIMILNPRDMKRSYIQLDRNADPDTREAVEKEYGVNPVIFTDGSIVYGPRFLPV